MIEKRKVLSAEDRARVEHEFQTTPGARNLDGKTSEEAIAEAARRNDEWQRERLRRAAAKKAALTATEAPQTPAETQSGERPKAPIKK